MELRATRRADGTAMDAAEAALTPFLGFVESPPPEQRDSKGFPLLRVEGWVVARVGRQQPRVRLQAGDAAPVDLVPDRERRDVTRALEPDFPVASSRCGFVAHVELPTVVGASAVPITIRVDDGEYVAHDVFMVRHSDVPAPQRADYESTWDRESVDETTAKVAVIGTEDEDVYAESALVTVGVLEQTVGVGGDDEVLEIGCGVGRVGAVLAPRCHRWIGADVSANMLAHAGRRLAGHDNVEFVHVNGWDLHQIADASLDVAYSTIVFMHLDKWDRYAYIAEARRVLRPGGRCYFDNIDLTSSRGWALFEELAERHHPLERPPNISKMSTADELETYLIRAGFDDVHSEARADDLLVRVWGRVPS
ncbi:MAG TPA: class I SAM-dependent methyltransferase [Acidimicrobiia bacterium]